MKLPSGREKINNIRTADPEEVKFLLLVEPDMVYVCSLVKGYVLVSKLGLTMYLRVMSEKSTIRLL